MQNLMIRLAAVLIAVGVAACDSTTTVAQQGQLEAPPVGVSPRPAAPAGPIAVSGRVLFDDGSPAQNAEITVFSEDRSVSAGGNADAQGNFTVSIDAVAGDAQRYLAQIRMPRAGLPTATGAVWSDGFVATNAVTLPTVELPDLDTAPMALVDGTASAADGSMSITGFPDDVVEVFVRQYDPDAERQSFPGDFRDSNDDNLNSSGFVWFSARDGDGVEVTEFDTPPVATMQLDRSQWVDLFDLVAGNGQIDIPMYSFDEGQGEWVTENVDGAPTGVLVDENGNLIQEAQTNAVRNGSFAGSVFVRFPVPHFSFWNVDYAFHRDLWGIFFSAAASAGNATPVGDAGDARRADGTPYPSISHAPADPAISNGVWLGEWIDAGVDPQVPDLYDDGIIDCGTSFATVRVNNLLRSRQDAVLYVNAAIDRNNDGDFSDPGEWVAQNRSVEVRYREGRSIELTDLSWGAQWMRLTATDAPIDNFDGSGEYLQGETEDYFGCTQDYTVVIAGNRRQTRVTSSGTQESLDCEAYGDACTISALPGQQIVLSSSYQNQPAAIEWDDNIACNEGNLSATCTFELGERQTINARFPFPPQLTVSVARPTGSGDGRVTGGLGIDCGQEVANCNALAPLDPDPVELLADPGDELFAGWTGSCREQGLEPTCTVSFDEFQYQYTTAVFGSVFIAATFQGEGSLIADNDYLICDSGGDVNCAGRAPVYNPITLRATPANGFIFAGWDGLCAGESSPVCTRGLGRFDQDVSVIFIDGVTLTADVAGPGTVRTDDATIVCNGENMASDCGELLAPGSTVTLTAVPNTTSAVFNGWAGACASAGSDLSCTLTVDADTTVGASFADLAPLTVTVTGSGLVASDPAGIVCDGDDSTSDCSESYVEGTSVTLQATPDEDFRFTGWGGACAAETGNTCVVSVDQAISVTANFVINARLAVDVTGNGRVESGDGLIQCGTDCTERYAPGTQVTLTATADSGNEFLQWTGACASAGSATTCTVTVDADDIAVGAEFQQAVTARTLTVTVGGDDGAVVDDFEDLFCDNASSPCSNTYDDGRVVTLTAFGNQQGTSWSWGGACAGTPDTTDCAVTMTDDLVVSLTFDAPEPVALTVFVSGDGSVTDGVELECGAFNSPCEQGYPPGTSVQLTGSPGDGQTLQWGGACAGVASDQACTVTMDQAQTVEATFAGAFANLSVTVTGDGLVFSDPSGINCMETSSASECTEAYTSGTQVTLTASQFSTESAPFKQWSGDCAFAGTADTCTLTLNSDASVGALFEAEQRTLTVSIIGDGSVAADGQTICASAQSPCQITVNEFANLSLDGTAATGNNPVFWGGDCEGTQSGQACFLTIDGDKAVSADFGRAPATVTVSVTGGGAVFGQDGVINCRESTGTCSAVYASGDTLVLFASELNNTVFTGWGGDCAGTTGTSCELPIPSNRTVSASFEDPA